MYYLVNGYKELSNKFTTEEEALSHITSHAGDVEDTVYLVKVMRTFRISTKPLVEEVL